MGRHADSVMLSEAKHLGSQKPRFPLRRDPSFVRMTLEWAAFTDITMSLHLAEGHARVE
jgi:hypothetical protein